MEEALFYIIATTAVFLFLTSVFLIRPIYNFSYKQLIGISSISLIPALTAYAISNCHWPIGFLGLSRSFDYSLSQIFKLYYLYVIPFILLLCVSLLTASVLLYLRKKPASQNYNLAISLFISNTVYFISLSLISCPTVFSDWDRLYISEQQAPWVLSLQIFSAVSLYVSVTAFITLLLSKRAFMENHWRARKVALGVLLLATILCLVFAYLADMITTQSLYKPNPIEIPTQILKDL